MYSEHCAKNNLNLLKKHPAMAGADWAIYTDMGGFWAIEMCKQKMDTYRCIHSSWYLLRVLIYLWLCSNVLFRRLDKIEKKGEEFTNFHEKKQTAPASAQYCRYHDLFCKLNIMKNALIRYLILYLYKMSKKIQKLIIG